MFRFIPSIVSGRTTEDPMLCLQDLMEDDAVREAAEPEAEHDAGSLASRGQRRRRDLHGHPGPPLEGPGEQPAGGSSIVLVGGEEAKRRADLR
jgi:hypothetical protein